MEKKEKVVSFRLTPDEYKSLKTLARARGKSVSSVIRDIVDEHSLNRFSFASPTTFTINPSNSNISWNFSRVGGGDG